MLKKVIETLGISITFFIMMRETIFSPYMGIRSLLKDLGEDWVRGIMEKKIHQGHRQRVKTRYLKEGLDAFADHQVLEMLLFYCIPMRDTNELAHKMIREYGSLAGLFEADPQDIAKRCGVSENTALLVSLIPSLARRYFKGKWGDKPILDSSSKAGDYALSLFMGRTYEVFFVICLDAQNRVNYAALVHEGTINEAPVYPRIIVETALRHQANSIILAHNHPGGSLRPSSADIEVTRRIMTAVEAISIKVVDHIIVAGDKYYSFAENGLLVTSKGQDVDIASCRENGYRYFDN